jgi:hypothetical protein
VANLIHTGSWCARRCWLLGSHGDGGGGTDKGSLRRSASTSRGSTSKGPDGGGLKLVAHAHLCMSPSATWGFLTTCLEASTAALADAADIVVEVGCVRAGGLRVAALIRRGTGRAGSLGVVHGGWLSDWAAERGDS